MSALSILNTLKQLGAECKWINEGSRSTAEYVELSIRYKDLIVFRKTQKLFRGLGREEVKSQILKELDVELARHGLWYLYKRTADQNTKQETDHA